MSLGEMVDRLVVVNLKLWHVQDKVQRAARDGQGVDAETVSLQVGLNQQRNRLMTEIDRTLDRHQPIDVRSKL